TLTKLHATAGEEATKKPMAHCQLNHRIQIPWSFKSPKNQPDHLLTICEHCRRQVFRITSSHENCLCRPVSCFPAPATTRFRYAQRPGVHWSGVSLRQSLRNIVLGDQDIAAGTFAGP